MDKDEQQHEETVEYELMNDEEHEKLPEEEKDFRDFVGVDSKAKSHPAFDNKRFRQIYRKHKDLERKVEAGGPNKDLDLMVAENRRLFETVEKLSQSTKTLVDKEGSKELEGIQTEISGLEEQLAQAVSDKRLARRNNDWDALDVAEEQEKKLSKAIEKKEAELEKKTAAAKDAEKNKEKETKAGNGKLPPHLETTNEWIVSTPWANMQNENFDPIMYAAAKEYDVFLMQKPKYKDKLTDVEATQKRLKEVQEYIEKRFNYSGNGNGNRNVSNVGRVDAERHEREQGKQLNADQKRTAHMMFPDITPEKAEAKYAANL
jgi:hypothetical protein